MTDEAHETVVDASVILKWVVEEQDTAWARGLLDGQGRLIAPELALSECGSAIWKIARRSGATMSTDKVNQLLANILYGVLAKTTLVIQPCDIAVHFLAARLAGSLNHPVYDCLYLALALSREANLATADLRFAGVIRRAAVLPPQRLITPHPPS